MGGQSRRAEAYLPQQREELIEAVGRTDALERARARADEFAEAARDCLDALPQSEYADSLRSIPTYVLDRDR